MIAVIFEVIPNEGRADAYFAEARNLRAELEKIEGFVSVERFESLATPGKFLSLSFWTDETAVAAWRNQHGHRETQAKGRGGIFNDYRLRVASVIRDYGMHDRELAPPDSRNAHI